MNIGTKIYGSIGMNDIIPPITKKIHARVNRKIIMKLNDTIGTILNKTVNNVTVRIYK
jgi:ribosomal protein L9